MYVSWHAVPTVLCCQLGPVGVYPNRFINWRLILPVMFPTLEKNVGKKRLNVV